MDILDENARDKALEGPGKTLYSVKTWNTIYEAIDDKYIKKENVECPEIVSIKI